MASSVEKSTAVREVLELAASGEKIKKQPMHSLSVLRFQNSVDNEYRRS